jgi:uncharacterized protein Usg
MPAAPALVCSLDGYGLTTAQIVYRIPDNHSVLQEFIWQQFDLFPDFPALCRFLRFWEAEIEGPLHSVTVAHARLLKPAELQRDEGVIRLH